MASKKRRGGRQSGQRAPQSPARRVEPIQARDGHLVSVEESFSESFSGPLPHPDILRGYDDIVPGGAERILKMAEEQARHRQQLESVAIQGANHRASAGLWLGFVIVVVVLVLGTVLILFGNERAGLILVSVDLATLAGTFVFGKIDQRRERLEKAALLRR